MVNVVEHYHSVEDDQDLNLTEIQQDNNNDDDNNNFPGEIFENPRYIDNPIQTIHHNEFENTQLNNINIYNRYYYQIQYISQPPQTPQFLLPRVVPREQ